MTASVIRAFGRTSAVAIAAFVTSIAACSSDASSTSSSSSDGGATNDGGAAIPGDDAGPSDDGSASPPTGDAAIDAPALPADRFATQVVSFDKGDCGGFGATSAVLGPPIGGGESSGSLDVLSLGDAGEIVLSFAPNAIVDGPGPDFIVFENAFLEKPGDPSSVYAEPGEVSVSDDGATWTTYPCTATAYPYGACAGWHPTYSAPGSGISPADPAVAGGDAFDLAAAGVTRARYVRIRDKSGETCTSANVRKNGFDLDAVAIVHGESP